MESRWRVHDRASIGCEIWLISLGGGEGLPLIERPNGKKDQKNIAEPAFSRDGRYVYFSQDATEGRIWQYNKDSTGQIFTIKRLDRKTGEVEAYVDGPGGSIRPTPSPDGKSLAFVRRTPAFTSALFVKDLATGKEVAVYDRLDRDLQETDGSQGNTPAIAWTPDGTSIVFWAGGKIRRVNVATRESAVIPIHVRARKKIHQALRFPVDVAPASFDVRMPRWAQISPDGTKSLFQALGHLYVAEPPGGEPKRLTASEDGFEFYRRSPATGSGSSTRPGTTTRSGRCASSRPRGARAVPSRLRPACSSSRGSLPTVSGSSIGGQRAGTSCPGSAR